MIQFELPLTRTTDPLTSKAAAESAKAFKARQISRIFCCLQDFGGQTYREIAARLQMEPVAVGRRLAEMQRNHLIFYTRIGYKKNGEPLYLERDGCRIIKAAT